MTTTFRDWQPLGDIPGFYDDLTKSLQFCLDKYDARLAGYVLMPSHVHLVVFVNGKKLSCFKRDFKKYTGQKVARERGVKTGVWMPRYDRVAIWSEAVLRVKLEYMHRNPVRAGLVARPIDWHWSSAAAYSSDRQGMLPVWKDW